MALATARFVQTGTQNSTPANWGTTLVQGWYNTVRKATPQPTPLVTHVVSGTPSISSFFLQAPGLWLITAAVVFNGQSGTLSLCRNGILPANTMITSSVVATPCCSILREFDVGDAVVSAWKPVAAAAMLQASDDQNFISFAYLGAC
jgi:hypothetical protein